MLKTTKRLFFVAIMLLITICFAYGNAQEGTSQKSENKTKNEAVADTVPSDLGIYTFYNEYTNCYLSYEGRRLILSETPSMWALTKANKNGFYVYAKNSELLLDIDNAWVTEGTTIKIWEFTGYDVQIWNINKNSNGTYSITYSGNNQYCLGFENRNATLQIRNESNPLQEWKVIDMSDSFPKEFLVFESNDGIVQLQLPLDILDVISEGRLQQWANELETAYYSFYELTDFLPYENIVLKAYKPSEYEGYAGWVFDNSNIIHIDSDFIHDDLQKMATRNSDWNFCALHEMGHMFDCNRPWNFESEMLSDLKVAYVLEKNGVAAAPAEFDASTVFYGADIKKAYEILGSSFSENYNIFGCTKRFLEIKEDIGWEPYKQTFHFLQAHESTYKNCSKQEKFEIFVEMLSRYSGKEVKEYFSYGEWKTILDKIKN